MPRTKGEQDLNNGTAAASAHFEIATAWPQISDADASDLLEFWAREGAIPDGKQARERLPQVVLLARDTEGQVAGVCTAFAVTPAQLGQPVYYWRAFVGARWRTTRLIFQLGMGAFEVLEAHAVANGYPCIGVIMELENDRFRSVARKAVWGKSQFVYVGKSPRGLDVRLRYFRGATLK